MIHLTLNDGVHYAVRIEGFGPSLLLLHGFTGSGATWTHLLPALAGDHRTIAVDLLGHGDSDSPPAARHAVERQTADLAEILGRLDAAPADVLGYSFGARIAMRLAIDNPTAVGRLVLESPSAGIADAAEREHRRQSDMRWVDQLVQGDMDGFVRDWAAQPIFASQANVAADVQARLAAQRQANRPDGLAASLLGAGQGAMAPLHDHLGDIRARTLVISGALDRRGTARATLVTAAIPGAVHAIIDGAGHTPHLEAPAYFGALIHDFLATPVADAMPSPDT